jgi:uracil-DNA glycosylase
VNIFKEIQSDLGIAPPGHGNLEAWAQRGVFLLNAMLTVRANQAASHQGIGWEQFTDKVIQTVSNTKRHVVFMLWGKFAMSKSTLIDPLKHLILTAPHPSPFSAASGFFGCGHFSQANDYLKRNGLPVVDWQL